VKSDFKRSGFRLALFLWFTLIGASIHAADGSTNALAAVVSPPSVNTVVADYWNFIFSDDATSAGRFAIRIPALGLYEETFDDAAGATEYFMMSNVIRFARISLAKRIKFLSATGMLSGGIAIGLMLDNEDVLGPASLTVAYN
jgi:hypothetical protein